MVFNLIICISSVGGRNSQRNIKKIILILVVQTRDLQSGGIHGIYNNLHFDTSGKEKFKNTQNHYLENTFGFKDKKTWFDSDFFA